LKCIGISITAYYNYDEFDRTDNKIQSKYYLFDHIYSEMTRYIIEICCIQFNFFEITITSHHNYDEFDPLDKQIQYNHDQFDRTHNQIQSKFYQFDYNYIEETHHFL
jgi:hypothetical protein